MAAYDAEKVEELKTYKVPALKQFVAQYVDLKVSLRKAELLATAQAAIILDLPRKVSPEEQVAQKAKVYNNLLNDSGNVLPDPTTLTDGWKGETDGIKLWPPTYLSDITIFLMRDAAGDTSLGDRLLNEYKQGKAYRYFTSEWLKQVFVCSVNANGQMYKYLKARCTPSMKATTKHEVWVITRDTGEILSGYCTCTAGLIQTCNHVAGLLFRLEEASRSGYSNPSCTSLPCTWNIPSEKTKLCPKKVTEMKWTHEKYGKKAKRPLEIHKKKLFQPVDERYNESSETKFNRMSSALREILPNAVMHDAVRERMPPPVAQQPDNTPSSAPIDSFFIKNLLCNSKMSESCQSYPVLSDDQVNFIEQATVGQSECKAWHSIRTGRITASNFHRVYTCQSDQPTKLVNDILSKSHLDVQNDTSKTDGATDENSKSMFVRAIKHGKNMEKVARQTYVSLMKSSHNDLIVRENGIFLDKEMCFIGASPDALVSCTCCGDGLLEIKCPYSRAHEDPNVNPPPYMIKDSTGKLTLKKSHTYFTQVQGQLAVTGKRWCDFFVYTSHGHIQERIYLCDEMWIKIKSKLATFYENHVYPELFKA